MAKTIVTGGAGFLGGHVAERLVELGHDVLVIDNLFAGRREHVPARARLETTDLGTVAESEFFALVNKFAPDYVVHLAAIHYIPYCMANPGQTFASNVRSTELIARAIANLPVKKMVLASTADVYAAVDKAHSESDAPAPLNVYGLSKLLSEEILAYAVRIHEQLAGVALRFFNIYGPRETNPHFIPRILELLNQSEVNEFRMGYLGGSRDFVHVYDAADAVVTCLLGETSRYAVFNVGTGIATPVREVLNLLKEACGDRRPVFEDKALFRAFDRRSLTPDISKIREVTGWLPRTLLKDGLYALAEKRTAVAAGA